MYSIDRTFSNRGDTVLLQKARELTKENNEDWYIVLHERSLYVAKLIVADRLRFVRVVHDDGAALRFMSILDAREFLKSVLSVPRAAVYLEEMQWGSEGKNPGAPNPHLQP